VVHPANKPGAILGGAACPIWESWAVSLDLMRVGLVGKERGRWEERMKYRSWGDEAAADVTPAR
jgi:hypothetical protein